MLDTNFFYTILCCPLLCPLSTVSILFSTDRGMKWQINDRSLDDRSIYRQIKETADVEWCRSMNDEFSLFPRFYFAKASNLDRDLYPNNVRAQLASRTLTTCRVSIKRSPWHKLFPRSWPYANPHRWTLQCRDETFIFVSRSKNITFALTFSMKQYQPGISSLRKK